MGWQRRHGRHGLPWQGSREPYRVWLSEVMLQQTQVATVRRYYEPFLARFPDLQALAAATVDDVLAAWSGLGYYRRARLLHQCARRVAADHGGRFPERAEELARLPGIGASTAAAIASICHRERAAILDGNVKRVLTRWLGFEQDLGRAAGERELHRQALALLPGPALMPAYTQALMDLGAGPCAARAPECDACPVHADCVARRDGRQAAFPVKTLRVRRGQRHSAWLWLVQGQRHWLCQRPAEGVWGGLWSLPERADLAQWQRLAADWPGRGQPLPGLRHALTHFDWWLQPLRWQLPARVGAARMRAIEACLGSGRWFDTGQALALGLPAPVRRLLSGSG